MGKTYRKDDYRSNKNFRDQNFKKSNKFKHLDKGYKSNKSNVKFQPEICVDDIEPIN
jgi:hypothetical protein